MRTRQSESVPSEPTETERRYQRLLELEARSGLPRREFARQQQIPASRLAWWKHELGRRARARGAGVGARRSTPPAAALVPVRVVEPEPAADVRRERRRGCELQLQLARSGHVVRLAGSFDAAELAALVQALEGASC